MAAHLRARGKNAEVLGRQGKAHIALILKDESIFFLTD
jgi:hypothetical protein